MKMLGLDLVRAYEQLGRAYEESERYTEARTVYRQAQDLIDVEDTPQFYGVVLHGLGNCYAYMKEDLAQALAYYRQAQQYFTGTVSMVISMEAQAYVLLEMGQAKETLETCWQALQILQAIPAPSESARMARIHDFRGRIYEQERQGYAEALDAYQQTLNLIDGEHEPQFYGVDCMILGTSIGCRRNTSRRSILISRPWATKSEGTI